MISDDGSPRCVAWSDRWYGTVFIGKLAGAMIGIGMMIAGRASSMTRLPFGLFAGSVILWPNLFTSILAFINFILGSVMRLK